MKSVLITFPDWEPRSIEGFDDLLSKNKFESIFIFKFSNSIHKKETQLLIEKMLSRASNSGISVSEFVLHNVDNNSSASIWHELDFFFKKNRLLDNEVYLDISTMPRDLVWIFMSNLKKVKQSIKIVYHLPKQYSKDWLSRDPMNPRLLFQHSGIFDISKKGTCLFIVTGFDADRVKQLIDFYEPNEVYLLIPKGNQFDNNERNNLKNFEFCKINGVFFIDSYNGCELAEIKDKLISVLESNNIILTSLGPKITAISLYSLFLTFPEVALSYVPCKTYNLNYSIGYEKTIHVDFVF